MTTGYTTTDALANSLPSVISNARIVREKVGVMLGLVEKQTLGEGIGLGWNEISLAQLTAQAVTSENTRIDNPQQISDTLFTVNPSIVQIQTFLSDRVAARISKNAYAKIGTLAQNAIQRKKDIDGLTLLDGASNSLCGAGNTLTSGHISAAAAIITSNTTEPGMGPLRCVLHGFQLKDLADELVAGVGTVAIPEGPTAQAFRESYRGTLVIAGATLHEDGNISIDSSSDAKGGVFCQSGIVLVQGRAPRTETRREPDIGGGGTSMWLKDEYAYGERLSGGSTSNWVVELYSDASAPTS